MGEIWRVEAQRKHERKVATPASESGGGPGGGEAGGQPDRTEPGGQDSREDRTELGGRGRAGRPGSIEGPSGQQRGQL